MRMRNASLLALAAVAASLSAQASSHREAPFIAQNPSVDGTDFYMFNSYEAGRSGFVTLIANYNPLQDAYGGPNYFALNPQALYEIHIDNNGDAVEDLSFQFRFTNTFNKIAIPTGATRNLSIPLINLPPTNPTTPTLNRSETYTLSLVRGPRRGANVASVTNATGGGTVFTKPVDNIGTKSIPDYAGYASQFIYSVNIPNCTTPGRVFVGQRREGFAVNLGEVFDLVNLNPLGARDVKGSATADKNVTSLALEVPIACLTATPSQPIIGAWTTASLRQARVLNPAPQGPTTSGTSAAPRTFGPEVSGGAWTQVSRLGSPLVNEVVIGVDDKDRFNASEPKNDGPVRRLRHPSDPAGAAQRVVRHRCQCAADAAWRHRRCFPDRRCQRQPAAECRRFGNAASEHGDSGDPGGLAGQCRCRTLLHAGWRTAAEQSGLRSGRLPEWPPSG